MNYGVKRNYIYKSAKYNSNIWPSLINLKFFLIINSMSFHAVKDTFFTFFTPQPLHFHNSLDL